MADTELSFLARLAKEVYFGGGVLFGALLALWVSGRANKEVKDERAKQLEDLRKDRDVNRQQLVEKEQRIDQLHDRLIASEDRRKGGKR